MEISNCSTYNLVLFWGLHNLYRKQFVKVVFIELKLSFLTLGNRA